MIWALVVVLRMVMGVWSSSTSLMIGVRLVGWSVVLMTPKGCEVVNRAWLVEQKSTADSSVSTAIRD